MLIVLYDDVPATALCLAIYPVSGQENLIYSIIQAIRFTMSTYSVSLTDHLHSNQSTSDTIRIIDLFDWSYNSNNRIIRTIRLAANNRFASLLFE